MYTAVTQIKGSSICCTEKNRCFVLPSGIGTRSLSTVTYEGPGHSFGTSFIFRVYIRVFNSTPEEISLIIRSVKIFLYEVCHETKTKLVSAL